MTTLPEINNVITVPNQNGENQAGGIRQNQTYSSNISYRMTLSSENVKKLSAADFNINSQELISLKDDGCMLVLFYVENNESQQLAELWGIVAQQVAGPLFGAVNMLSERSVASAFTRLKADGSNPLHWAGLRQYPFILVYRNHWPVAVYNGPREVQAIIDYALTLACQAGYYEPVQIGASMQSDYDYSLNNYAPYLDIPNNPPQIRTVSTQFSSSQPIRRLTNIYSPIQNQTSPSSVAPFYSLQNSNTFQQLNNSPNVGSNISQQLNNTPILGSNISQQLNNSPIYSPTLGSNISQQSFGPAQQPPTSYSPLYSSSSQQIPLPAQNRR